MCEQCTTEMLSIYSETKGQSHVYIGIARVEWGPYEPGDIMIGECNSPDIMLTDDLFTEDEWNLVDTDEEAYERRSEQEDHPVDRFLQDDDATIWCSDAQSWPDSIIPMTVLRFTDHFGAPDVSVFGYSWSAWVVVKVAEYLQTVGIPLNKEGRRDFALQFSPRVGGVQITTEPNGVRYSASVLVEKEDDWDEEEVEWTEGEEIPALLRP